MGGYKSSLVTDGKRFTAVPGQADVTVLSMYFSKFGVGVCYLRYMHCENFPKEKDIQSETAMVQIEYWQKTMK